VSLNDRGSQGIRNLGAGAVMGFFGTYATAQFVPDLCKDLPQLTGQAAGGLLGSAAIAGALAGALTGPSQLATIGVTATAALFGAGAGACTGSKLTGVVLGALVAGTGAYLGNLAGVPAHQLFV
jgi:hypothetical protein